MDFVVSRDGEWGGGMDWEFEAGRYKLSQSGIGSTVRSYCRAQGTVYNVLG